MASAGAATGWLRGGIKAVPSGDCLIIVGSTKAEIPPEKTITLSSLIAPRLVSYSASTRRGGSDEPFAWESRDFLRKLCIGKEVTFRVDYTVPSIGREFGSVFLGEKNVALFLHRRHTSLPLGPVGAPCPITPSLALDPDAADAITHLRPRHIIKLLHGKCGR